MSFQAHNDLRTSRLDLIAMSPAMLQAEKSQGGTLSLLTDCTVPPNWPPIDWEPHVIDLLLAQYERCPNQVAWQRYAAIRNANGTRSLVGSIGAFWNETTPDECEIGYTVLPPFEGQGLATEAAQALVDLIRHDATQQPQIKIIIAHTFPHLVGSIRILEKCGFLPDGGGAEPGSIRYRLLL